MRASCEPPTGHAGRGRRGSIFVTRRIAPIEANTPRIRIEIDVISKTDGSVVAEKAALDAADTAKIVRGIAMTSAAPITRSTWRSRFRSRNQVPAPTARSSVSDAIFCTVMIRKKKPVRRITTTNARPKMIANDCWIDETPGSEATAVARSSASTPSTCCVIDAARSVGSTPDIGSTPTRLGSTAVASGLVERTRSS